MQKFKEILLLLVMFENVIKASGGKDDDDNSSYDDDDDDDGIPKYCPKKDGMFPNPTDCTSYYNCVGGQPIVMSCAPGLLFDPKTKMCNFPGQVKCSSQCRGRDGLFASQHRCDEFVLCSGNKAKKYRCKKGLYFDSNLQVCNYKDAVICNLPGMYSKDYDNDKPNKGKSKNYSNHNDNDGPKSAYVFVKQGEGNVMAYGVGRRSVGDSSSDKSPKVELGQKYDSGQNGFFVTPEVQKEDLREGHVDLAMSSVRSVCPLPRGLFGHPEFCHVFYQCWDGEVLTKTCPNGLLFNHRKHTCQYFKDVDCGDRKLPQGL